VGPQGEVGPQGPPGLGFDAEITVVKGLSWDPSQPLPASAAVDQLKRMIFFFSRPLSPMNEAFNQTIVWVRHQGRGFETINGINGSATVINDRVEWQSDEDPARVLERFNRLGGVIYIDIDCGYLFDASVRAVSGSPHAMLGMPPPYSPAGTLRTWILLRAG
jgi:hypothetical protein